MGQRLFAHMHYRCSDIQFIVEFIVEMCPDQRFGLHAEHRTVFTFNRNRCTGFQQWLVHNLQSPHRIIDHIIDILCQLHPTGKYFHRALSNVLSSQGDLGRGRRFVTSFQIKLILLGILFRFALCLFVQVFINVLTSDSRTIDFLFQPPAEWFQYGKNDPPFIGIDRYPLDIIETPVRNRVQLGIQPAEIHHRQ